MRRVHADAACVLACAAAPAAALVFVAVGALVGVGRAVGVDIGARGHAHCVVRRFNTGGPPRGGGGDGVEEETQREQTELQRLEDEDQLRTLADNTPRAPSATNDSVSTNAGHGGLNIQAAFARA